MEYGVLIDDYGCGGGSGGGMFSGGSHPIHGPHLLESHPSGAHPLGAHPLESHPSGAHSGETLSGDPHECEGLSELSDLNYMRHVGYSSHQCGSDCGPSCIQMFFSPKNIRKISCKVTELLQGVNKQGRPIIVPDKTISHIMSQVWANFRPETGDIFGRYNVGAGTGVNYVQRMIDQVINIITTDVKVNLGMEENNSKLSIWTTVLGDFNQHGLRRHSQIKLREKRPAPMLFHMNY